jgi:hypothetical protein
MDVVSRNKCCFCISYTKCKKKKSWQNAETSMFNAVVYTMYSHYRDKRFIYRHDSPKYLGCSVVLPNFFNLILINYLNHLRPVVSIGTVCQSQSHVFWDVTSCSLMSNYDVQTSMLLPFLWYTQFKTDCLAHWDRGSNGRHAYNFLPVDTASHYTRDECLSSPL